MIEKIEHVNAFNFYLQTKRKSGLEVIAGGQMMGRFGGKSRFCRPSSTLSIIAPPRLGVKRGVLLA